MAKKRTRGAKQPSASAAPAVSETVNETPFEALAGICSVLVIGLFILTFIGENFLIPSGSMENTLLVGDHLLVDSITLAPATTWMPLTHYREPRRGDVVVFKRPAPEPEPDAEGNPQYLTLVKRLVGMPGDRIHLHDGIVYVNGVAQSAPKDGLDTLPNPPEERNFLDEFPSVVPTPYDTHGAVDPWVVELPTHIENGELVVPPEKYFMMGDHRHGSMDSRYWGFVPRENILGRPLFNYWSFKAADGELEKTGIANSLSWMMHVALHFFTDTRWKRTLHVVH
jgi:signal peptidase I